MSNRRRLNEFVKRGLAWIIQLRPSRKLSAGVILALGATALAVALLVLVFGHAILNRYGKGAAERAFARADPGCAMHIGDLDYSFVAKRLVARSIELSKPNMTLRTGAITLTGVRWMRLFWGTAALADVLANASLDVTNIGIEFPAAHYRIRCSRLRASVPASEIFAEQCELRALEGDEEFFAAHNFRATRFHLVVSQCKVLGLACRDLLQGKSCRAASIQLSRPSFDILVNRDKPVQPFVKSPLMVNEALAGIPNPFQVNHVSITDGFLRYCERLVPGADPGVLTFGAVNMSIDGLANRVEASTGILLRAQGKLMNAGTMNLAMSIPVCSSNLSLHYSGSLSAMDLTRLNEFLDAAEHTRIKSGSAREVTFDIDVAAGQARGRVRAIYNDLEIAVLDKQTGSANGLKDRLASLLANAVKIRKSNPPNASGSMKEGEVNYTRRAEDEFLQFAWFALRSGVLDVISH